MIICTFMVDGRQQWEQGCDEHLKLSTGSNSNNSNDKNAIITAVPKMIDDGEGADAPIWIQIVVNWRSLVAGRE